MNVEEALAQAKSGQRQFKPATADKDVELVYDLGNLACFDASPVDTKAFNANREEYLLHHARDCMQLLVNQLFELPTEPSDVGRVAILPEPTTVIPREKPIPKPKAATKWEKFAQTKGIIKRKRSRMEFDEDAGEYKPRFGYKRAARPEDDWVIEAKPGQDPNEDPFEKRVADRKDAMAKQEKRRLGNLKRAGVVTATPATVSVASGLSGPPKAGGAKPRPPKADVEKALRMVQKSTASLGKFDKTVRDEPDKNARKRHKFAPVASKDNKVERNKNLSVLEKIVGAAPVIDANRAANRFQAAEEKRRKEDKGKQGGYRKQLKTERQTKKKKRDDRKDKTQKKKAKD